MPDFNQFALDRLTNLGSTAEGTNLPPRQTGDIRVPIVSGLKVLNSEITQFGPVYTLGWLDPDAGGSQIVQYNIFVIGLDGTERPQGPFTATKSPATIRIQSVSNSQIRFIVQTQLHNGMTSQLEFSPSVATPTVTNLSGLALAYKTVTSNYYISQNDFLIIGDTSGGNITVYLPKSPSGGDTYSVKKSAAANILTINGNGKSIDGGGTVLIYPQYGSYTMMYTGTEWSII